MIATSLIAIAIASQSGAAASPAKRERPHFGDYFSVSDYPAAAVEARQHGRVDVRLTIGADGRISGCAIERSSGSPALDQATCSILQSRARYQPARNAAGAAVAGEDVARLIWFLRDGQWPGSSAVIDAEFVVPPPPPPAPPAVRRGSALPAQRARANLNSYFSADDYPGAALRARAEGATGVVMLIGPNGPVTDCRIVASSGSTALDAATCRILRSRARYAPARNANGDPVSGMDQTRITWRLPTAAPAPPG